MLNYQPARHRYIDDAVATAAPPTLLVMLYDRLAADLERGEAALRAGRRDLANTELKHAQDIITELSASLDQGAWEGAGSLMSIYAFLGTSLVEANVSADADHVAACRNLVAPLHQAWQQAAAQVAKAEPARALGDLGVG